MERKKKVTKVQEKTYYELCEQFMVERGLDKQKYTREEFVKILLSTSFMLYGLSEVSWEQNSKSLYKQIFKPLNVNTIPKAYRGTLCP